MCVCVCIYVGAVCVCGHASHSMCVEIRGQLCGLVSLSPYMWVPGTMPSCQACWTSTIMYWAVTPVAGCHLYMSISTNRTSSGPNACWETVSSSNEYTISICPSTYFKCCWIIILIIPLLSKGHQNLIINYIWSPPFPLFCLPLCIWNLAIGRLQLLSTSSLLWPSMTAQWK